MNVEAHAAVMICVALRAAIYELGSQQGVLKLGVSDSPLTWPKEKPLLLRKFFTFLRRLYPIPVIYKV